ncbi:MAG: hypothetical protein KAX57_01060 [Rhodoferax sp.]|jgi:hypothetical protein|uniref:hypothetical protein n=1 Tax=Rhodoferax sp. TaxID=50421 RepID=UPI001B7017F9|nr:hypothetical protein [Rhodoferax sp.]MBP8285408.1 hypothetical protein [Rhodoferax sp.]MBP9148458.1 hypothetical protein [Rhodoferax sp.]MBP9736685.1 hypothetical protein [Rhodoferax sp.]
MTISPANTPESRPAPGGRLKNVALFLASPFIGLYYAVLLPGKLLQLAMAERQAAKQTPERGQ